MKSKPIDFNASINEFPGMAIGDVERMKRLCPICGLELGECYSEGDGLDVVVKLKSIFDIWDRDFEKKNQPKVDKKNKSFIL